MGRVGQRGNSTATLCGMLDWLQALVVTPVFRCHEDECRLPTPVGTRRDGQITGPRTGTHLTAACIVLNGRIQFIESTLLHWSCQAHALSQLYTNHAWVCLCKNTDARGPSTHFPQNFTAFTAVFGHPARPRQPRPSGTGRGLRPLMTRGPGAKRPRATPGTHRTPATRSRSAGPGGAARARQWGFMYIAACS